MAIVIIGVLRYMCLAYTPSYKISKQINLVNPSPDAINSLIKGEFRAYIGAGGMVDFNSHWPIALYLYKDIGEINNSETQIALQTLLHDTKNRVNIFEDFLWFAKDNSIYSQFIYAQFEGSDTVFYNHSMTYERYTNCKGLQEDVLFTTKELDYCNKIKDKYDKTQRADPQSKTQAKPKIETPEELLAVVAGTHDIPSYFLYNRIRRAFEYIRKARSESFLPSKIGCYMSFLETLFSIGTESVSHKVGMAVGYYLQRNNKIRQEIYNAIILAYEIRSRYLHGDALDPKKMKDNAIEKNIVYIDKLVREIFIKVIMVDSDVFLQIPDKFGPYIKGLPFSY